MSAHTAPASLAAPVVRRVRTGRLLAGVAVGYSAAWLVGLAVPVPMLDLDASQAAVLEGVVGHEGEIALRSLLVHGLAGVALAVVAVALARSAAGAGAGAGRLGRFIKAAGVAAVGLSLTQFVMELVLAGPVADGGDAAAVDGLLDAVNRVDGVKMVALAGLVAAGAAAVRHGVLPRWLRGVAVVLVPALLASAAGYGLLVPALAPAAYVSLPLLLVWVTGAGLALAKGLRR